MIPVAQSPLRRKGRTLALLLVCIPGPVLAQSDPLDEFISAEMERQNIPGLSLAVLRGGEILRVEGYGFSDRRLRIRATPETVYRIASVSKQFIATGIMMLVEDGRLGLDDPISTYLDGAPTTWNSITIRHVLSHTSGLVREAPGFEPSERQSDANVIKTAYDLPLLFEPGERWEYSNLGYFALAEVLRVASGDPWADYLREQVFRPAGMNATWTTTEDLRGRNLAIGYTDNDQLLPADLWPAVRPSGAFFSTVSDLARWDGVLFGDDLLKEEVWHQLWAPVALNDGTSAPYGLGWQLEEFRGRRFVHHRGGMLGFRSAFARFVDDQLTVVVLMNLDDVDIMAIVFGVASLYLPPR